MESAQDIPIITDAISPNSASPSVIRECLYIKSFWSTKAFIISENLGKIKFGTLKYGIINSQAKL